MRCVCVWVGLWVRGSKQLLPLWSGLFELKVQLDAVHAVNATYHTQIHTHETRTFSPPYIQPCAMPSLNSPQKTPKLQLSCFISPLLHDLYLDKVILESSTFMMIQIVGGNTFVIFTGEKLLLSFNLHPSILFHTLAIFSAYVHSLCQEWQHAMH